METIKFGAELFREFGAAQLALMIILSVFTWFLVKIVPASMNRMADTMEQLAKTLIVHDERALQIVSAMSALQAEIQIVRAATITPETLQRIHERVDRIVLAMATKDDIRVILETIKEEVRAIINVIEVERK